MRFVRWCALHPVSILSVSAAFWLFGIVSLPRLRIEELPDVRIPEILVVTEFAHETADEVERQVTVPMENALSAVRGLRKITSVSRPGLSSVLLRFGWNADLNTASMETREQVDGVYPYLPHGTRKPLVFSRSDTSESIILAIRAAGGGSIEERYRTIRYDLQNRLMRLDTVAALEFIGLAKREIQVEVDLERAASSGLSLARISRAIELSVFELPAGTVRDGSRELPVRSEVPIDSLNGLRELPIAGTAAGLLRLRDVARIGYGSEERTSFFRFAGDPAVGIRLSAARDAGPLKVSRSVRRELDTIRSEFSSELLIDIAADNAGSIRASFRDLIRALLLGSAAALLVILVFFRSVGLSLIVFAAVPASTLPLFFFMYLFDLSLNLMSLSGIAMGIGLIVDNATVVLERIVRETDRTPDTIGRAAAETGSSTAGSTFTTLLVFVPILFIPGIAGALFSDLAVTISIMLVLSFVASMTLVPALSALLPPEVSFHDSGARMLRFENRYRRLLATAVRKPAVAIIPGALLLLSLPLLVRAVPREIMPFVEHGSLSMLVSFPSNTPLSGTERMTSRFLSAVGRDSRIVGSFAEAGYLRESPTSRAEQPASLSVSRITIAYRNSEYHEIAELVRHLTDRYLTGSSELLPPLDPVSRLIGTPRGDRVRFLGPDRKSSTEAAVQFARELTGVRRIVSSRIDTEAGLRELRFRPDPDRTSSAGVTPGEIADNLSRVIRGTVAGRLPGADEEIGIRVRGDFPDRFAPGALRVVPVPGDGSFLPLASLGEITEEESFSELYRVDRKAAVTLSVQYAEGADRLTAGELPVRKGTGVGLESAEAFRSSLSEIGAVFGVALILMYLLLGAWFESLREPLLLMTALPFSASGSLALLLLGGKSLNVSSFLGILLLFGTTINTTILLRTAIGPFQGNGLVERSVSRLRPILVTVLTTITALLPLALNSDPAASVQSHTSTALVGGLIAGTAGSLFIFPVLVSLTRKHSAGGPG